MLRTAVALTQPPLVVRSTELGERLALLDSLRALAILLVLLTHFVRDPSAPRFLRWFAARGYHGVDIFFVLSG